MNRESQSADRRSLVESWVAGFNLPRSGREKLAARLWTRSGSKSKEQALLLVNVFRLRGFDEAIGNGLASRYVRIRIAACSAAAGTRLVNVTERIASLAESDPSPRVRLWAIQALKRLGDKRWRTIALATEMRRLNCYEWDDWKILLEIAQRKRRDRSPRNSVYAGHYDVSVFAEP